MTGFLQKKNEFKPFFCLLVSNFTLVKLVLVLFIEINLKILSASGLLLTLRIATIASTIFCSTISILIRFKLFTKARPLVTLPEKVRYFF